MVGFKVDYFETHAVSNIVCINANRRLYTNVGWRPVGGAGRDGAARAGEHGLPGPYVLPDGMQSTELIASYQKL